LPAFFIENGVKFQTRDYAKKTRMQPVDDTLIIPFLPGNGE
jgi:hypothetical protein